VVAEVEDVVQLIRVGIVDAFETARAQLDSSAREAKKVADDVMIGLTTMPLIQS
jgi:hypothetical protein